MKNDSKINVRMLTLLVLTCLVLSLALVSCSEDTPIYGFELDTTLSDEGVALEGNTLFLNVGQRGRILHDKDLSSWNVASSDSGVVTVAYLDGAYVIQGHISGSYNVEITHSDSSVSYLHVYIRNETCGHCEQEFSNESELMLHPLSCGHRCWYSEPAEHTWCGTCQMFECSDEHPDHNALTACGHTVGEAVGDEHTAKASCGEHYMCAEDIDKHQTLQDCGNHYKCLDENHMPFLCGHYVCDGSEGHIIGECGDHFLCKGGEHNVKADCGEHYVCEQATHTGRECGHTGCSGQHQKLDCYDQHMACDEEYGVQECGHCRCEGEHFFCPVCENMNCDDFEIPHEKYYCGHIFCNETMEEGHEECEYCGDCITYGTHSSAGCEPPEEEYYW